MAYPMLESPLGNKYFYDGKLIDCDSQEARDLAVPTEEVTYYETIRIKDGVMLYSEDHLARLYKSVMGIEAFEVDVNKIGDDCRSFLKDIGYNVDYSGNLRIVLTKTHLLIHICEANIPTQDKFDNGINSLTLQWERVAPNIKVFRGDYKQAVADTFARENSDGHPYEIVLCDNEGKYYEGSKSNLFVIVDNKVYSAPDEKILLGITRNRVMSSLANSGAELVIGTFTMDEMVALKEQGHDVALFVSSTPFDILPIKRIDDVVFDSASNPLLKKISADYVAAADKYIRDHRF
ncbi:MAG: aminotransferase class IV [Saccharofermentans sp.]|nr:aminotransferase class IV [Saccharofermentans sp.]